MGGWIAMLLAKRLIETENAAKLGGLILIRACGRHDQGPDVGPIRRRFSR